MDLSPVPEPPGLVALGRVRKLEALVSALESWARLPLPNGRELVRSVVDDDVAEVVDLSQPIDAAVRVVTSRRSVEPMAAFAVGVKSFESAKTKLGERHRLVPGDNGELKVEGIFRRSTSGASDPSERATDEGFEEEEEKSCVLAHAVPPPGAGTTAARLVCGQSDALESLVPYLTRTVPRQTWDSDVHVELRPEPVRAPLADLRSAVSILARNLMGSSPAIGALVDALLGEVVDIVNDTQRFSMDARVGDAGIDLMTRLELQSKASVLARAITPDRADGTPPAFWHLPADTDTAFFARGAADPALFERPRELIANLLMEATDSAKMPEAERRSVRDLVADRMLSLFTNGGLVIYAKGFEHAAVEKALQRRAALDENDTPAQAEAEKAIVEQVVGWHLYQVSEPISKVGPILKDWSALWNRPAFVKWAKGTPAGSSLPKMRIAPPPARMGLPKETVHLEISIPRDDAVGMRTPNASKKAGQPPKQVKPSPVVLHLFAVPDGGATWLAFGLDAKLVAKKAAAALASAPDTSTLGKAPGYEALREAKANGGGMATLRGLLVFTAVDGGEKPRSPFSVLASLPNKGATPITFTSQALAPSDAAKGGGAVAAMHVSRAVIEDVIKLAFHAL